jgi:hypothetical protein
MGGLPRPSDLLTECGTYRILSPFCSRIRQRETMTIEVRTIELTGSRFCTAFFTH